MAYRSILTCLNETRQNASFIPFAAAQAAALGAHLTGLYVIPAVRMFPSASFEPIPRAFEATRRHYEEEIDAASELFSASAAACAVAGKFRPVRSASPVIADEVIRYGRESDLLILSQTDPTVELDVELDFVERVIIDVGRPVLVVPLQWSTPLALDHVVIAWNGKREASRAAFDSLPILQHAQMVHLISIAADEDDAQFETRGVHLADTLRRHGVSIESEIVFSNGRDVSSVLMARMSELRAGLLVMGAYGHSRLHEFVLGGATRQILSHLHCPVLFAH